MIKKSSFSKDITYEVKIDVIAFVMTLFDFHLTPLDAAGVR